MKVKPIPIDQEVIKSLFVFDKDLSCLVWAKTRKKAGYIHKASGYKFVKIKNKTYQLHRVVWCFFNGDTGKCIDHINGDKLDNSLENLRTVSDQQNQRNQKRYTTNNSGHTGVSWHSASKKWRATIHTQGKAKYLGSFDNKADAIECRKAANKKYGYHKNHGCR